MPQSSLTPVAACFSAKVVDDLVEVLRVLGKAVAFRAHVGVVEAIVGRAEQLEEFEGDIGLQLRCLHRVFEPGTQEGLAAEGVATRPGEGVPVGDRKAQVVFHALAHDNFVGLVVAEGQRIGAVRALIFDFLAISPKNPVLMVSSPWVSLLLVMQPGAPHPTLSPPGERGQGAAASTFSPTGRRCRQADEGSLDLNAPAI